MKTDVLIFGKKLNEEWKIRDLIISDVNICSLGEKLWSFIDKDTKYFGQLIKHSVYAKNKTVI